MPVRSQDPVLRFGPQLQTESTLPEELGATFRESWQSALLGPLLRIGELQEAETGVSQSPSSIARFGYFPNAPRSTPILSRQDAQERVRQEGMEGSLTIPEGGIRSRALQILIDRKREEQKRNTIRQQSPGGAGRFSANLLVSFAGQLVDPLNVTLAFVPVIGPSRYANMLSRASGPVGRFGVRGTVGALEGTAGAAIVEPLNLYANWQQQADWDAFDSAVNIGSGAFFGSALHAGAGLFGDMIRPPRPFERAAIAETLAAPELQPASLKPPELDSRELALQRERTIVLDRLAEGRPLTRQEALAIASENFNGGYIARTKGGEFRIVDSEVNMGGLLPEGSWVREAVAYDSAGNEVGRLQYANDGTPPTVEVAESSRRKGVASAMYKVAYIRGGVLGDDLYGMENVGTTYRTEAGDAFRRGMDSESVILTRGDGETHTAIDAEAERLLGDGQGELSKEVTDAIRNDKFRNIRPFLAQLPQETQEGMFRMALAQAITGRPIDVSPGLFAHYGDVNAAADAAMRNAQEVAGADHVSSQMADARNKGAKDDLASLKEQAAEEEATLREQAKAAGLDIDDMMTDAVDAAAMAKAQAEAVKIATLCMLRSG